ncbi:MAG: alpha-1,2-fucosyltransferase [Hyphomicrobiales bacterium]|nr:alpha-1,2-fucosyltransferase [Hyphomicrobiales bacterium]
MGNQMFQYAAGRALALRSGSSFQLDCRHLDSAGSPPYGLGHFNIERALSSGRLPPERKGQRIRYNVWLKLKLPPQLLREKHARFDERLLAPLTDVFLDGYWQSERYFADAADTIRVDFQFTTLPDLQNARHLERISAVRAVSLHVRRGDYLRPEVQAQFGSPTLKYYRDAVDLIASNIDAEPVVYVFSDDPEWVRDNLILPFETRVMAHNGPDKNYEDMRLMSACRHHVIANSSFSWWGAWLNASPDKIVVAPKQWFVDPRIDNPDITPDSWLRLDG